MVGGQFHAPKGPGNKLPVNKNTVARLHSRVRGVARPAAIPRQQWLLPAAVSPDGSFVTLQQIVSNPDLSFNLDGMSEANLQQLVIERIKRQKNYPAKFMIGVGEVSRLEAIEHVKAGTRAGKFIMESEQNVIRLLLQLASQK